MKDQLLKLSVMLQILKDENGQDLIEYALVVALIAFAATAGMSALAGGINNAFIAIGTKLTNAIPNSPSGSASDLFNRPPSVFWCLWDSGDRLPLSQRSSRWTGTKIL